ncbi:transcriptional regulator, TetR family [Kribbella flavida DSM 17836]|uniref:Transcriptional regulator, TetR family n=1 Tax=Kribbella flavida (strain DSM 17836 / JCM 10339 / NBRC 14399) TaxID=479435 RepID=D2Q2Z7_KRIFD|nr:TetR/AcrR family transcriptional regulator [Kribbella flavida]ADB32122.1 transcriptional regulator, TetR family [Kribbella flavida DSM 17836]
MSSRDRWLETGLAVLADEGIKAVTIERLCDDIGLSKGSFYHHFGGAGGYHTALLAYFEERETARYVAAAEAVPAGDARARLDHLKALVAGSDDSAALERAVRAWAAQDGVAREALERIDARRIGYLQQLLVEITGRRAEAADLARIVYLVLLGSYHVLPPVPLKDVERLWTRILATT